jgi:hypothetical protein
VGAPARIWRWGSAPYGGTRAAHPNLKAWRVKSHVRLQRSGPAGQLLAADDATGEQGGDLAAALVGRQVHAADLWQRLQPVVQLVTGVLTTAWQSVADAATAVFGWIGQQIDANGAGENGHLWHISDSPANRFMAQWIARLPGGGESRDISKLGPLCIKRWSPRVPPAEVRERCRVSRALPVCNSMWYEPWLHWTVARWVVDEPATHEACNRLLARFPRLRDLHPGNVVVGRRRAVVVELGVPKE